jgi:hypothetical protein
MEGDHGTPAEVREEHEQPKRTALGVAALDMFAPDDVGAPVRPNGSFGRNIRELNHLWDPYAFPRPVHRTASFLLH